MKIKISLLTLAFFFAPSLVFASTPVWGTINSDTVWTAESGPYLVDFSIVPEGITLTVEEGTVVKFTGQRSMLEVSGNLVVSGTELSPVVFTSINDDSVGGDTGTGANEWGNILIKNGGVATIDHAEIRHGGWTGWLSSAAPSNIWNNGGNLTLTNSKISNAWTGITHSAGNTALTENIFTENNTGISVSGTGRVHFDHNNFFNNTGNVAWFDLTNGVSLTHSDNTAWGGTPGLVLAGEAGADYVFEKDGAPYVIDHFTVPAGKTVTARPGTAFKLLNPVSEIFISGTWNTEGTSDDPVYFTSIKDDTVLGDTNGDADSSQPANDDWEGIFVLEGGEANFDHAILRYGGYSGWLQSTMFSNISNNGGILNISNSEISRSWYGIHHEKGTTNIDSSTISQSSIGIYAGGTGSITINNNTFFNNDRPALLDLSSVILTNANNTAHGTGKKGLELGGAISVDQTLTKDLPYLIDHLTIPAGRTLTVRSGSVFKFLNNVSEMFVSGKMNVEGSGNEPVYFTSVKDDTVLGDTNGDADASQPTNDDWEGILVLSGGEANFDHSVLRYGGYSGWLQSYMASNISNDGGILNISHSDFSNSWFGIHHEKGTTTISQSSIHDNPGYGVYNGSAQTLNAENNYWGSVNGPTHPSNPLGTGDKVTDRVDFMPYLGFDPTVPVSVALTNGGETENDDLQDGKGVADKTQFTFSVVASENLVDIKLVTDSSDVGINPGQFFLYASGTEGVYSRALTFPKGHYRYHFEAVDGNGGVYRYPETEELKFTTGYSNVAFLPGIEASRLYGGTGEQLWEPEYFGNPSVLALDENGSSTRSDIYTKDVIDNAYLAFKGNIYSSFISSMNDLKSNGTIADWEPLPYDWRLSFDDILNNGAELSDGRIYYTGSLAATGTPYIIQEIRRLAATSDTGKVTIISHSMGGLVAKNLTVKLGTEESSKLIDQMIFIDSPQTGTPQTIGVLLHGFDQGLPAAWLPAALTAEETRDLSQNMPSIYNLLPSSKYFAYTDDPVVTFDDSPLLASWRTKYGAQIHSSFYLSKFLTDPAREPLLTKEALNDPPIVNPLLLEKAKTLHTVLDSWIPPVNVRISEIIGWGEMTAKTIEYKQGTKGVCIEWNENNTCKKGEQRPALEYDVAETMDGDGTVVAPSALYTTGSERWWVDLKKYDTPLTLQRKHADILEVPTLRTHIQNVITRTEGSVSLDFISRNKPINTEDPKTRLRFTLHSPLSILVCDNLGNCTDRTEQNILESDYREYGSLKIIDVPNTSDLHLELKGIAPGSFTLNMQEFMGDAEIASTTFAGIPSLAETIATLNIPANGGIAGSSPLLVDENGDGTIDLTLAPKLGEVILPDFTYPEAKISVDPITKDLKIEGIDENPTTVSKNGSNYTITDSSGNTTTLFFQKTFTAKRLTFAKLTGVQYGTDPKISLPSSSFLYLWNPALISQTISVKKDFVIEAMYNKKKDETTVWIKKEGEKTQKQIFTGLKVVELTVDKGVVGYEM